MLAISFNHLSHYQTHVNKWFQQNGKSEQFLETVFFQGKGHFNSSAAVSARCVDERPPGPCQFGHMKGSSTGHVLDQGPTKSVKASEPCIGHHDRPNGEQNTKNMTTDVQYAINKCDSLGSGKHLILHGIPSATAKDLSPHMAVFRRHFWPNMHFQCCMLLQGTLGGDFGHLCGQQ